MYAVAPFFKFGNWAASDQVQGGEAEGEAGEMHCAFAADWWKTSMMVSCKLRWLRGDRDTSIEPDGLGTKQ